MKNGNNRTIADVVEVVSNAVYSHVNDTSDHGGPGSEEIENRLAVVKRLEYSEVMLEPSIDNEWILEAYNEASRYLIDGAVANLGPCPLNLSQNDSDEDFYLNTNESLGVYLDLLTEYGPYVERDVHHLRLEATLILLRGWIDGNPITPDVYTRNHIDSTWGPRVFEYLSDLRDIDVSETLIEGLGWLSTELSEGCGYLALPVPVELWSATPATYALASEMLWSLRKLRKIANTVYRYLDGIGAADLRQLAQSKIEHEIGRLLETALSFTYPQRICSALGENRDEVIRRELDVLILHYEVFRLTVEEENLESNPENDFAQWMLPRTTIASKFFKGLVREHKELYYISEWDPENSQYGYEDVRKSVDRLEEAFGAEVHRFADHVEMVTLCSDAA